MLKEVASWTFTIAIFGLTLFVGFMVLTDYFDGHPEPETYLSGWQEFDYYALNEGAGEAPVTILEVFDYQCSHCRDLHHNLNRIKQDYPEKVSVKPIPHPLNKRGSGYEAAAAAICAEMETEDPTGVHTSLFEHQEELDDMEPDQLAESAISDSDGRTALYNCLQKNMYEEHLSQNLALGEQLNLTRVPALIINGELYFGALSERMLSNIIESHL